MSGTSVTAAAASVLFDALDEGVLVHSIEESTVTCNRAAERILGLTSGTVEGASAIDPGWRVTRADGTEWLPEDFPIVRAIRDGHHTDRAIMHIDRGIGRCSISVNARPIEDDGRIVGGVATFRDVTAEYVAADQASDNQRQLLDALHGSDLAVATSDREGRVLTANAGFQSLVGRSESELIGVHFTEFSGPDSFQDTIEAVELLRAGRTNQFHASKSYVQPDGTLRYALMNLLVLRDGVGAVERHVSIVQDVTDHVRSEQALEIEARTDPLTGLLNRRGLLAALDAVLSEAQRSTLVAFVDLDGFKAVNDRHGHETGDRLLKRVADSMREAVRGTDILGRLGGDEFVILFTGAPVGSAPILARSIRIAVEAAALDNQGVRSVSASIGIVTPEAGETAAHVLARADAAMYEVKRGEQRSSREQLSRRSRPVVGGPPTEPPDRS